MQNALQRVPTYGSQTVLELSLAFGRPALRFQSYRQSSFLKEFTEESTLLTKLSNNFSHRARFSGYILPPIKLERCLCTNSKAHINLVCVSSSFIFIPSPPFFPAPSFGCQSLCYMAERFSISRHVLQIYPVRVRANKKKRGFVKEVKERAFFFLFSATAACQGERIKSRSGCNLLKVHSHLQFVLLGTNRNGKIKRERETACNSADAISSPFSQKIPQPYQSNINHEYRSFNCLYYTIPCDLYE